MEKILVIRLGSLGDVILTSPTVLNLKMSYPECHLTYLTKAAYLPIVEAMDGVDAVHTLPDQQTNAALMRALPQLERENFNIVVDLHGNVRSWFIRRWLAAPQTVPYDKGWLDRFLLLWGRQFPQRIMHTIEKYNGCITRLGGNVIARRPILHIDPDAHDETVTTLTSPDNSDWVAIAPGAKHITKQWPVEKFVEVAVQLHETHGVGIIWAVESMSDNVITPADRISPAHYREVVGVSIMRLASILDRCKVTIANDSGVAHLSSAIGTPVVALFGPTHPVLGFAPSGQFDRIVEVDEPCRPCSRHGEKKCHRSEQVCFTTIHPERVVTAVKQVLDGGYNRNRALFVDRDGTLIVDKHYLTDPDQVEFEQGAVEALKLAQSFGFKLVVISNQSGVARGRFGLVTVERVNSRLEKMLVENGVTLDGLYYCPHYSKGVIDEFTKVCHCRKPSPGMPERAASDLGIDLRRSWVIGDKLDDFNLGYVIGGGSILVRTGYGRHEEQRISNNRSDRRSGVTDNLLEAVRLIERVERHG